MKKITSGLVIISGLLLSACASQTGWTPTVDTSRDPHAHMLSQDMAECRQLATQSAGGLAKETAMGAAAGGLLGAAGGAITGAFTGNAATGAAIGAAAGGFGGAAKQGMTHEERFRNAYNNCLSSRGHPVIR